MLDIQEEFLVEVGAKEFIDAARKIIVACVERIPVDDLPRNFTESMLARARTVPSAESLR